MTWREGLVWVYQRFGRYGALRYVWRSLRTVWQDRVMLPLGRRLRALSLNADAER